jgi:ubiquinone/menaquinone biosynthesis C-methylase UbiE
MESLTQLLQPNRTVIKDGIYVTNDTANSTVWDKLAKENTTHAVISHPTKVEVNLKSTTQIADIKSHLTSTDILLDCGCGHGRVAQHLLPDMQLAGYIGLDSSYEMLQLFKQRYNQDDEQTTPVVLLNADINSIPLQPKSVDVVIVCAVFLHNHKSIVEQALAQLTTVVKPGGTVLVYSSFPRLWTLMGLQGQTYQMLLNLMGRPFKNGPIRYYTAREIKRLFADFSNVQLVPVGFSVLPKTIIILPWPLEVVWRVGIANPINHFLEKITPQPLKRHFAVHFDVIAKQK